MNDASQNMLSALQQELGTLEEVCAALKAEALALSEGDVSSIEASILEKEAALASHQNMMAQRPPASEEYASNEDITALQDRLAALATECQELNRQNGTLISKLSDRTRAALNVLQGTEESAVLYSASGVTPAGDKGSRVIGKA